MEKLSRDTLILLALEMDMGEILNMCQTNKRINEKICKNDMFWLNKIRKERPNFLSSMVDKLKFKNYKDLYMKLQNSGDKVYKLYFDTGDINVKGYIFDYLKNYQPGLTADDIIKSELIGEFIGDKLNGKSWLIYTNNAEYTFEPFITNTKTEAINLAKNEINFHLQDEVEPEVIQKYYDEIEKTDSVTIEEDVGNFTIYIEEIKVV